VAGSPVRAVALEPLDVLEAGLFSRSPIRRALSWTWPKLSAVAIVLASWQLIAWSGWRPDYLLPGPGPVLARLMEELRDPTFYVGLSITLRRAITGYTLAILVGSVVGVAVARTAVLRAAIGSVITGLQSMPSIAWFPLAILLFQLSESAIIFVVLLGAAPAIAGGLLSGLDHIPPPLVRSGRSLGAKGLSLYRHVLLPAALPAFVGGLKQGWAFAWRSLMAGALLVVLGNSPSLGVRLQYARELADAAGLLALMIVILTVGIVVDSLFGVIDGSIKRRWGLADG
jgi:NitT/TauT family transport system permease protein